MQALAFHLAAPVLDKDTTRDFYHTLLGCAVGREDKTWIDFDFFGHQLSFHVTDKLVHNDAVNTVDGKPVPIRHFGAVLDWDDWHDLSARLSAADVDFVIEPYVRFKGKTGEQATMFFLDPSGNALEFKAFKDPTQIFAR